MTPSDTRVIWSGTVPLEYGFYRLGGIEAIDPPELGDSFAAEGFSGTELGVCIYAIQPEALAIRVEISVEGFDAAPHELGPQLVVRHGDTASLTSWEFGEASPPGYGVVGPGVWSIRLERDRSAGGLDETLEIHRLFLSRVGDVPPEVLPATSSAPAGTGDLEHDVVPAVEGGLPPGVGVPEVGPTVHYVKFVQPRNGIYFISWDTATLRAAAASLDLDSAIPVDTDVLMLDGGVALRQREGFEWIVQSGERRGMAQPRPTRPVRVDLRVADAEEIAILNAKFAAVRGIPRPAAAGPCDIRVMHDMHDAASGIYDWYVQFMPD